MINYTLLEFGRRPWKHEHVMAFAAGKFGGGNIADLFYWNVINDDLGIVLIAPIPRKDILKPSVILRQKMRPLCDPEGLSPSKNAIGKSIDWSGRYHRAR